MQRQTVLLRATKHNRIWLLHVQHLQQQTEHRFNNLESLLQWLQQTFALEPEEEKTHHLLKPTK
jgi:hypothetical protein